MRRHGENREIGKMEKAVPRIGADERGSGSGFDNGKDFDLLMENASHSHKIQTGIPWRSRWGRLFGGDLNCTPRTEVRQLQHCGRDFLAFGPLVVAEVRTE